MRRKPWMAVAVSPAVSRASLPSFWRSPAAGFLGAERLRYATARIGRSQHLRPLTPAYADRVGLADSASRALARRRVSPHAMSVFRRNFRNVANMYYGHLVLPAAERETPAPTPQVEKESPRPAAAGRSNPTPDHPAPLCPRAGCVARRSLIACYAAAERGLTCPTTGEPVTASTAGDWKPEPLRARPYEPKNARPVGESRSSRQPA